MTIYSLRKGDLTNAGRALVYGVHKQWLLNIVANEDEDLSPFDNFQIN
jgi:hypothetical protein